MADESLDKSASLDSNTRSNVKVTRNLLPKTLPRLRRQGPLLLQPAPRELPGAFTSNASDLLHVRYQPNRSNEETAGTGAFLVAYSDGKVDVLLEMEPVEPRFEAQVHSLKSFSNLNFQA